MAPQADQFDFEASGFNSSHSSLAQCSDSLPLVLLCSFILDWYFFLMSARLIVCIVSLFYQDDGQLKGQRRGEERSEHRMRAEENKKGTEEEKTTSAPDRLRLQDGDEGRCRETQHRHKPALEISTSQPSN